MLLYSEELQQNCGRIAEELRLGLDEGNSCVSAVTSQMGDCEDARVPE